MPGGTKAASPLLDQALAPARLRQAWRSVRRNGGMPGADGVTIARFERRLDANLNGLAQEVRTGAYRPWPPLPVRIETGAKVRRLAVPAVRDRVLQRAALEVVAPVCEGRFAPSSFGYRPGRGVREAVAQIVRWRRRGMAWVLDADIDDCFGSIDHALLRQFVGEFVTDPGLRGLLELWIVAAGGDRGVPLGGVVSPLFCNLYLHQLDLGLARGALRSVRYADDFVVLCPDAGEAARALAMTHRLLAGLNLRLNPRKTRVVTFEAGFTFLGARFAGTGRVSLGTGADAPA